MLPKKTYALSPEVIDRLAVLATEHGSVNQALTDLLFTVHPNKHRGVPEGVPSRSKLYFCTDCTKQLDFEVEERAAILEYDANMPLQDAERLAPMLTYQARMLASSSAIS